MIGGNLIFASFELGKILALMPLSLIKGLWYHITIHLIPILSITAAFRMISESPQWVSTQSIFNICSRTMLQVLFLNYLTSTIEDRSVLVTVS